jgi:hypothetical protein
VTHDLCVLKKAPEKLDLKHNIDCGIFAAFCQLWRRNCLPTRGVKEGQFERGLYEGCRGKAVKKRFCQFELPTPTSARIFVNTQFPVQDGIALSFSGILPIVNWR